jgi:hypothetical protein
MVADLDSIVRRILRWDGYARVGPQAVLPGDVAVYEFRGTIEHVGVVLRLLPAGKARVISKWGPYDEWEHDIDDVPEEFGDVVSIWRRMM